METLELRDMAMKRRGAIGGIYHEGVGMNVRFIPNVMTAGRIA